MAHLLLLMNAGQQKNQESMAVERREVFRSWLSGNQVQSEAHLVLQPIEEVVLQS